MRHPKGRRFVGDVQVERDFLDLLETFEVALSEEAANKEIENLQNSLDLGNMNFEESANLEAVNSQESTNSRAENFQRPANSMIANSQRPANVEGTNFQEPANLANNGSRSNSSSPVRVTYVYSRRGKKLVLTESGFTYCYHATHRQNKMHWANTPDTVEYGGFSPDQRGAIPGQFSRRLTIILCFSTPDASPAGSKSTYQLLYMMSKKGNVMLSYQGHSYHLKYTKNSRKTWRCSRHCSFRCRATITTVDNHIWPMFLRTSVGTRSIVYNGYKFYKKKGKNKYSERWRCSLHQHFNCKAMLFTTHDQLIAMKGEHTHAPPKTLASLSQVKLVN
ncbi:unnamed protein product [Arctia plantaginis]|uniref:FLYWCH-type domain-containing protein n=1 Tax=Arctia plantaginis TaxID=874455 RepID=A0A8S0ZTJ0_ARCPL|nr:unnamed protein product [Arctia plantaginis]